MLNAYEAEVLIWIKLTTHISQSLNKRAFISVLINFIINSDGRVNQECVTLFEGLHGYKDHTLMKMKFKMQ